MKCWRGAPWRKESHGWYRLISRGWIIACNLTMIVAFHRASDSQQPSVNKSLTKPHCDIALSWSNRNNVKLEPSKGQKTWSASHPTKAATDHWRVEDRQEKVERRGKGVGGSNVWQTTYTSRTEKARLVTSPPQGPVLSARSNRSRLDKPLFVFCVEREPVVNKLISDMPS